MQGFGGALNALIGRGMDRLVVRNSKSREIRDVAIVNVVVLVASLEFTVEFGKLLSLRYRSLRSWDDEIWGTFAAVLH